MIVEAVPDVQFKLHLRCANCRRDTTRLLNVPRADGAPRDIDELMDSAFLREQRFACTGCEGQIGTIVAVTMPRELAA